MSTAIMIMLGIGSAWGFVSFCASIIKTIAAWVEINELKRGDTFWHQWMDGDEK